MDQHRFVIRVTLEVLGSPKEHVEETLKNIVNKLKEEKDIKILDTKIYEAKQLENTFWSTFADIEFQTLTFSRILDICYDYMPSVIEILEPSTFEVPTQDFARILNDFLMKLHKYAMVLKKLQSENIFMMKELEKIGRSSGVPNPENDTNKED